MDSMYSRYQPIEQSRWNEANIDTMFYAGSQSLNPRTYNFSPGWTAEQYYFNIVQQPVNMITGFERQRRKGFMYQASEGGDNKTTDQYTRVITHACNIGSIHQQKSKAKELACISGLVMAQPYLDYTDKDAAQGELKVKVWEYNSFIVDPFCRDPSFSDAQFIWFQEYISRNEAISRFGDKVEKVRPMSGSPQGYGSFYFLPENYNMARNDLLIVSYVWYKWVGKKKKLYSKSRNQFFDFGKEANVDMILNNIPDLEIVTIDAPVWKLCTVLNDQLMYKGGNPIGDIGFPAVPYYWNYDPHIPDYRLRTRSLIYPMRSPQVLYNYKVITNNDIQASVINSGWMRKVGAVANEDNLKKTQAGWDVLINEGYEMTDCQKIIPTAVPESDIVLANEMKGLMYEVCGINLENWSGQQDKQISSLTMMLKQAANLMVFQKFFDQWDFSDQLLGDKLLRVVLNNWNEHKVGLYLGEEPTPLFYSKIFTNYQTMVEEADLTPTQQNLQAQQMLDINAAFQREVFTPSQIIPKMNITGKGEIIPMLQEQEKQQQSQQAEMAEMQHAVEDAKLKELYSKSVNNIANARQKQGAAEANIGLFEERLSMISRNRAMATKEKMMALEKLVETMHKYGELEAQMAGFEIEQDQARNQETEDREKVDAKMTAESTKFLEQIMQGMGQMGGMQQQSSQNQEQMA
jgi:hypothetical protein